MQKEIETNKNLFQLVPKAKGFTGSVLAIGRYLVGRAESCEVVIPSTVVSAVHAVLEVTPRGLKVYDMNSRNGTYVNGSKVVAKEVSVNDILSFGNVEFTLKQYKDKADLPPVLDSLEPMEGNASTINNPIPELPPVEKAEAPSMPPTPEKTATPEVPKSTPELPKEHPLAEEDTDGVPYIVYPLSADPGSDYSEYIFEDRDELYPIFKYEHDKQAVEIIILFKDSVYSVDYLPEKSGVFKIAGATKKDSEIEFPYLGKDETVPFVEIQSGNCLVNKLHNYESFHLSDDEVKESSDGQVNLQGNDIVKLTNGDLEIYVRRVSSPPKVKSAPFFRRDKELFKYLALLFFLIVVPVFALNLYEVDEEKQKEKDPERIATILYKQKLNVNKNKTVEKTEKKKPKKQTAKKKPVVKKDKPKPKKAKPQKSNQKKAIVKTPGTKSAKKIQKVKRVKNPIPKNNKPLKTARAATKSTQKTARTKSASVSKSKGRVQTYKSIDFKSSINTLVAKGGTLRGAKASSSSTSTSIGTTAIAGGVGNVKSAKVGTEAGSLVGSATGKLGQTRGTEGLATKSGVYTAGIPSETVVLGSMDPDIIRKILRDNIPFFRSCYQKELDKRGGKDVSGMIRLVFSIGASGHVSRAGVDGKTKLPGKVKGCVVNVLRGIKFPRPLGGGTVDVKQPFNFYPKRL